VESSSKLKVKHRAVRALERLPRYYKLRVLEVLDELRVNPIPFREYDVKKLKGFEDAF